MKVSGTVRELVFDDTVADIYLGPTLTARLRARFSSTDGNGHAAGDGNSNSSKRHDDRLDELNGSGGGEVQ